MSISSKSPSLPLHLRATLAQLVEARYTHQRDEVAGWRGLLEERECDDGTRYYIATRDIQPEETVFLIDHLWCATLFSTRAQLQAHPLPRGNLRYICGLEREEEDDEDQDLTGMSNDGTATAGSWDDEADLKDEQLPVLATDGEIEQFLAQHTEDGELDLDGLIDRRSRRSLILLETLLAAIPRIIPDLRTFSLRDTHLDGTVAPALRAFLQAMPNLKAVWLNGNPALFNESEDPFASSIFDEDMLQQQFTLVNRKLTPAYGAWTLSYLGDEGCEHDRREIEEDKQGIKEEQREKAKAEWRPTTAILTLDLSGRLVPFLKPAAFAVAVPNLRRLDLRDNPILLAPAAAASSAWQDVLLPTLCVLSCLESLWVDPPCGRNSGGDGDTGTRAEGESERARKWEVEVALAVPQLRWINGRSITRLTDDRVVMGREGGSVAEGIDKLLLGMWPHVEPMRLAASERHHAEVYWYAMDLPGQGIAHAFSSSPGAHLAFVPMRDRRLGITFSVAWPLRAIKAGEVVRRDAFASFPFLSSSPSSSSVSEERIVTEKGEEEEEEEEEEFRAQVLRALWGQRLWKRQRGLALQEQQQEQQQVKETLQLKTFQKFHANKDFQAPAAATESSPPPPPVFPLSQGSTCTPPPQPLLIYTDMPVVQLSLGLTDLFAFTEDPREADILWATPAFLSAPTSPIRRQTQWRATLPNLDRVDDKCELVKLLTNQSHSLQEKDSNPPPAALPWLPRTYCLPEDLPCLLQEWAKLSSFPSSATWILKPPHLARGWDIVLTRSLPCVLRHLQASGRLAVSNYLPSPDLWKDGHKYDLRMYLLLLSPSLVLIHDHFRVRRAARPYSMALDDLEDLSRHLTNTTLGLDEDGKEEGTEGWGGCPTETVSCLEFVGKWEELHPGREEWKIVRRRIEGMLAECFGLLSVERGGRDGRSLGYDAYGRALVGVDVLLDRESLAPHLIEINASPNVQGMLSERPSFMDEVFAAAFVEGGAEGGRSGFRPL
ncbi:tubulin--tyrosine ligase-like protein 12 [Nannochloropsis oceanica]